MKSINNKYTVWLNVIRAGENRAIVKEATHVVIFNDNVIIDTYIENKNNRELLDYYKTWLSKIYNTPFKEISTTDGEFL